MFAERHAARLFIGALLCISTILPASAAAIRVLNSNGVLIGASNIEVDGLIYDVEILDGSCNGLFSGCDISLFHFQTATTAEAASRALMEQVFLDAPDGQFDSLPSLTRGCETSSADCLIFTLFARAPFNDQIALGAGAVNYPTQQSDYVFSGGGVDVATPTDAAASVALAKWSRASSNAIPEGSTIALLALGLTLMSLSGRTLWSAKRRSHQNVDA